MNQNDQGSPNSTTTQSQNNGNKPNFFGNRKINTWLAFVIILAAAAATCVFAFQNLSFRFAMTSVSDNIPTELQVIQGAIKSKNAKWEAGNNEISKLSKADKVKRVGASEETYEGPKLSAVFSEQTGETSVETVIPATIDWRNNNGNYVSPVKNQGNCGSCWAFAASAGLESNNLIAGGTTYSQVALDTSEQVVVSCSGAGSCSGGSSASASGFLTTTGSPNESCYPYTATNGLCSTACVNWQVNAHKIKNYNNVSLDLASIKNALNTYGPLVTTFTVYNDFYYYNSGIYSHVSGSYIGRHAVLIVGYDDASQAFIVKNSWGTGWGEAGYFRIAYSQMNNEVGFGIGTLAYLSSNPNATSSAAILLSSPNGGENWQIGTTQKISWTYQGDPGTSVKIDLYNNGVFAQTIAASATIGSNGAGSYIWTILSDQMPSTVYKIVITSNSNSALTDSSDKFFTISEPPPASITTLIPNSGENWKLGKNNAIKWSVVGNVGSRVKIELYKAGAFSKSIASGVNTSKGSYNWRIPTNQALANDYQIKITSESNSNFSDMSDSYFSIVK